MSRSRKRFDERGYQRRSGKCTGTRKYSDGHVGSCDHPSHGCFTGDMRVLTPMGYVRIDELKQGSAVMVYDEGIRDARVSQVKKLILHSEVPTVHVRFVGTSHTLKVTRDHTLYGERGWLKVSDLVPGSFVRTQQGTREVLSIGQGRAELVYNLYPYGEKTFIVEGLVAHSFTRFRKLRELAHGLLELAMVLLPSRSVLVPA
jgi:hypothetical protein